MFDNQKIARQIRQARIQKDMTQMDLADRLGVTFQAVSNWERGNSLPDVGRLEELCQVLELPLEMLLGMDAPAAAAVDKAIRQQPMTVEELEAVAPMLPPSALRRQVEAQDTRLDLSALAELAPFLDEACLSQLVLEAKADTLEGLEDIAPFLSRQTLRQLADQAQDLTQLEDILPFLDRGDIDALLLRGLERKDWDFLESAAPFASPEGLDALVRRHLAAGGSAADLEDMYPFLSKATLHALAKAMLSEKHTGLKDILPFL